jgi:hypothetical protein
VNYHKWNICSDACKLGKSLGIPIYKFLKDPLIRKYGKAWYKDLVEQIETPEPLPKISKKMTRPKIS